MTIEVASMSEVSALASKVGWNVSCNRTRSIVSVKPPIQSPTAAAIFSALMNSHKIITVAFIDNVSGGNVENCYFSDVKTVFVRTDKQLILTEYPGDHKPEMPFIVLLYHELGHAKQDLDGRLGALKQQDETKELATGKTISSWQGGVKVRMPVMESSLQRYKFPANVEYNNMRLHEYPICIELGIPIRSTYTDLAVK